VEASAPGHKSASSEVRGEAGRLSRTVHLTLPSAVGSFTVESEPPGAALSLDGVPLGRTPFVVTGVRMDERHRIDLTLPGHELDQFVMIPEKDGNRFVRKLVPLPGGAR